MSNGAATVLHVLFAVFQSGSEANGGVESITEIIENLSGVRRTVLTQKSTAVSERWRRVGNVVEVRVPFELGDRMPWRNPRGMLKRLAAVVSSNRAAYRVLRSEPGSVLHANDMEALLHTGFGAWLARVPIVLNIRDVHEPSHPYGRKWCLAQCLPSVIVALSREMKTELLARLPKAFFGKPEWDFIYSIVDPQVMRPLSAQARADLRRDLSISPDEFAIGYVANIFPKKNQLGFLREAAGLVLSSCPKARIHFLGDFRPEKNPYAGECAAAASEIDPGGDRIRFHGFKAQIGLWYQALDLIVLGSRQEGLARCMAEGIACGTPMVSFDVCSAREILEAHGCGLVVSRGDYSSMVNRIVELSEAPDRRRAMGENGAEAAAKLFAPAAAVENYRKIYQQLAAP